MHAMTSIDAGNNEAFADIDTGDHGIEVPIWHRNQYYDVMDLEPIKADDDDDRL